VSEVTLAVRPAGSLGAALVRVARPKQWAKNLLVAAAPAAAGTLGQPATASRVLVGIGTFCLVASGVYFLNDAKDVELDRAHPTKRSRPIAAGIVPVGLALALAGGLDLAGLALATAVAPLLGAVLLGYIALNVAYTFWLKRIALLDLAAVASCFVLRAVAGGAAADVTLSAWFLLVVSFGAVFVVAGKRFGELAELGAGRTRATLESYSPRLLKTIWLGAALAAFAAYCLWAFEQGGAVYIATMVPFGLALHRYSRCVEAGEGSAPEELLLGEPGLVALALAWVALFVLALN
jgi:decaprenyl-phosphate phosphoribosyltransferase